MMITIITMTVIMAYGKRANEPAAPNETKNTTATTEIITFFFFSV